MLRCDPQSYAKLKSNALNRNTRTPVENMRYSQNNIATCLIFSIQRLATGDGHCKYLDHKTHISCTSTRPHRSRRNSIIYVYSGWIHTGYAHTHRNTTHRHWGWICDVCGTLSAANSPKTTVAVPVNHHNYRPKTPVACWCLFTICPAVISLVTFYANEIM